MSSLRRPASSTALNPKPAQKPRTRAPSVAAQPPPTRKPLSAITTQQSRASNANPSGSTLDDAPRKKAAEPGETNIQVVVRVRGYAPHESVSTLEQSILTTSGPRCQQIDVAMEAAPVSSAAVLQQEASSTRQKSYHFDHVFGPEADQGMVYQDVVGPILEQVMAGYNCTIFAYGQTGTGKTYTMEGDLTSQLGTYSSDAGIIPRTLYRLFHTLEMSKDDYSVKSTFIELYNEDLRDLLSTDASAPLEQSVGTNQHGLRMYDDARGKGVVIQGLEEVILKDAAHGLNVLRRGSHKRQIAATNCNEQSSRSHSVFTMTVFIKDKGSKGEEMLKIGKLNLVDLAGSENIGRSGAENKRAREAGMINQSLLTLGRVINALVEKNSHIPYRESKLTRLLQESLGGRTKTCIIATVSQDRTNMEETLSTLDYALRAKSIKNRPELNTRITAASLMKDFASENARLKSELQASREQSGVWFSNEDWATMHADHEERRLAMETLKRSIELNESKLASSKEQLEQVTQLALKREDDARVAKDERQEAEARATQLDVEVASLTTDVQRLTDECNGLLDKLSRTSAVLESNRALAVTSGQALSEEMEQLNSHISAHHESGSRRFYDLLTVLTDACTHNEEHIANLRTSIKPKFKQFSTALREIRSDKMGLRDRIVARVQQMEEAYTDALTRSESSQSETKLARQSAFDNLTKHVCELLETVGMLVHDELTSHRQEVERVRAAAVARLAEMEAFTLAKQDAAAKRIGELRAQVVSLETTISSMQRSSQSTHDKLLQGISQLLTVTLETHTNEVCTALDESRSRAAQTEADMRASETQETERLVELNNIDRASLKQLDKSHKGLVARETVVQDKVTAVKDDMQSELGAYDSVTAQAFSTQREASEADYAQMVNMTRPLQAEIEEHARLQSAKLKGVNAQVTDLGDLLEEPLHTLLENNKLAKHNADHLANAQETSLAEASQSADSYFAALQAVANAIVSGQKDNVSTGQTPRRPLPVLLSSVDADE